MCERSCLFIPFANYESRNLIVQNRTTLVFKEILNLKETRHTTPLLAPIKTLHRDEFAKLPRDYDDISLEE